MKTKFLYVESEWYILKCPKLHGKIEVMLTDSLRPYFKAW